MMEKVLSNRVVASFVDGFEVVVKGYRIYAQSVLAVDFLPLSRCQTCRTRDYSKGA